MNWKAWKIGAVVSVLLSLFVAMAGVAAGISWHQFLAILGAALSTHFGAYIKDHPTEKISWDTERVTRTATSNNQPPTANSQSTTNNQEPTPT